MIGAGAVVAGTVATAVAAGLAIDGDVPVPPVVRVGWETPPQPASVTAVTATPISRHGAIPMSRRYDGWLDGLMVLFFRLQVADVSYGPARLVSAS